MIAEHRVVLESAERAFVIRNDGAELAARPWGDNTLVLVEANPDHHNVIVLTGDQFGPFEVTTRYYDDAPPLPGTNWEDVVELSIRSTGPLAVAELVDHEPSAPMVDEPGEFRVRVSARGRAYDHQGEDDEPPEETPVEWYLVEAWKSPMAPPQVVRLTSEFARTQLAGGPKPLVVPEMEAGLAAAARIGRDVDRAAGARAFSGRIGEVRVRRTLMGTRRKLFVPFAHATNWSSWVTAGSGWSFMSGPSQEPYPLDQASWAFANQGEDQLSGGGGIRTQFTEVDPPRSAVRRWEWVAPVMKGDTMDLWQPVLAQDTDTAVVLTQHKDDGGQAVTTVDLTHTGLPEEWLQDMTTWWGFQFAIADHAKFGTK
jgi:hypothetical protein